MCWIAASGQGELAEAMSQRFFGVIGEKTKAAPAWREHV
jgi:hypothetical protein